MKVTKANITSHVKNMLATNQAWAVRAMVRIYTENQTAQEQAAGMVVEDNGIGFTGTDGVFLSSLAQQYIAKNFLSEKQMVFVMKKMSKYHKQVIAFSNPEQLKAQVEKLT